MKPTKNKALFSVMAVILLLNACVPATQPQPTQNPDDIANQVATSVALTVAAQNTQTAAAEPVEPPATNTPLPTQTEVGLPSPTPIIPTATPFEIVPPTTVPSGGGGSVVKADYACSFYDPRPAAKKIYDNKLFKPNDSFDIKWKIVNTGTKSWVAGLDLKYFGGTKMTSVTRVELPAMAPGDQYEVDLRCKCPRNRWNLRNDLDD